MEGKTFRQKLVEIEEKRMLRSFRLGTKGLKIKQQENIFERLYHSRNRGTGSQEAVQLESTRSNPSSPRLSRNTTERGKNCQVKPSFRIPGNPHIKETHVVQTLSRSLSIPSVSVTSERAELTPVTHLQADALQIQNKLFLCLPNMTVQEVEQENVAKKSENLWLGSSSIALRGPSSPKLQSNPGSPTLQRCKSLTKLANSAADVDISNVLKVQSPKLKRADTSSAVAVQSGGKIQKALETENLQDLIPKEKEEVSFHCTPTTPVLPKTPSSPKLQSNRNSPIIQRRSTSPCLDKFPNNANDVNKSNALTIPRSPKLKRADARAATADQSGGKIQNALQTENLKMQAFEQENTPKEKEASCIDGAPVLMTTPLQSKMQSICTSPVLRRGRSLSCSNKLQNNDNDTDESSVFTAPKSPNLKRAEAKPRTGDPCANETSCKGTKMLLNKGRSLSMPLPQKPEKEDPTLDKKDSGKETELRGERNSGQKIGFADIRNHLSIPVNQSQPKHLLSVDHVPFQRSRSMQDIKEALRAGTKDSQPGCQPSIEDAENKPPYENSEQAFLAQGINSPRMVRRLSARSRTSSMPKLLGSSEGKTFANVTAFNIAAQHTVVNKPVKFREITEPLKKSKCFHALSSIVSLSDFQTAMLEIHNQQEQEKALEENQPSMATSFQEIKNCRYLRIPEHYQSNK
ncbi:hypothetical protein ACROYT_G022653 [Oculina patagonica]